VKDDPWAERADAERESWLREEEAEARRKATRQQIENVAALAEAKGYRRAMEDLGYVLPETGVDVKALLRMLMDACDEQSPSATAFGGEGPTSGFSGRR
jgi:hypothetical protein